MNKKLAILLVVFIALSGLSVFADGCGGMYYDLRTSEYPFLKDYPVRNNSMGHALPVRGLSGCGKPDPRNSFRGFLGVPPGGRRPGGLGLVA